MKKILSALLVTIIFCGTTPYFAEASFDNFRLRQGFVGHSRMSGGKPVIITDFDDVWINKTSFLGALAYLKPLENLFTSKKSTKEIAAEEPAEKKVRKFGNLPLRLLDYGRHYPRLSSYIPGLVDYIGKSRCINQPIDNLYKHLKAEGYTIDIATNKDHVLYDLCIEKLGNEIPSIADKVFVAEPQSDPTAITQLQAFANQPATPENYKNMMQKALTIKETNNIIHVPSKKPATEYYNYVIQRVGADNDMIFIDDNQDNVDAFNALQKDSPYLRLGIRYDESNLHQFAEDIKKAGLVSEEKDQALLDEIRYPGITGKIKQKFNYIFAH